METQADREPSTFTDLKGRVWTLALNLTVIDQIAKETKVDLLKIVEDELKIMATLYRDPRKLVQVLWCIVSDDAERLEVSPEDFGRGLAGDCLWNAAAAVMEATIAFFPNPRQRAGIKAIWEKALAMDEALKDMAMGDVASVDVEAMASELYARLRKSAGSAGGLRAPSV
jgi:hypothetical protein